MLLFSVRYALADRWLWAGQESSSTTKGRFNYDIHGLVTVRSDAELPELERFRIDGVLDHPTVRVVAGSGRVARRSTDAKPSRSATASGARSASAARSTDHGDRMDIVAARWLMFSAARALHQHRRADAAVDVRQARLRLVHGACIAADGEAYLITARTDTGKTTTILKTLDHHPHAFLSDDLTLRQPRWPRDDLPQAADDLQPHRGQRQDAAAHPARSG